MRVFFSSSAVLLCILFSACGQQRDAPASTLPVIELRIGKHQLTAEVAESEEAQQAGLMFRREMPPDHGMLFLLGTPRPAAFWMKNTYLPLSIAYIDQEGVILEIHPLEPLNTTSVESKADNVAFALEMHQGWFDKKGIRAGEKLEGIPSKRRW